MVTVLTIDGMFCARCSAKVRDALRTVPGVETADVAWEAGRAVVTHEGIPGMLVAAVEDAGFAACEA